MTFLRPHSCWAQPALGPGSGTLWASGKGRAGASPRRPHQPLGPVLSRSLGIQHDGNGNDCDSIGKQRFIMSPQLLYDSAPLIWSPCSQQYITRFLE